MNETSKKPMVVLANHLYSPNPKSDRDGRRMAGGQLMAEVISIIERVMEEKGATRREIAASLGLSESTISRQLNGDDANLTIHKVADLFWALDDKPYLSSAVHDWLVDCGTAVDLRPKFDSGSAPNWLSKKHVGHTTGAAVINLKGRSAGDAGKLAAGTTAGTTAAFLNSVAKIDVPKKGLGKD